MKGGENMKNDAKKHQIISTKRNKGLEPVITGVGIIGYDPEIHEEDSQVFSYKLPLGAIKRLIRSYYDTIQNCDEENIYLATSSSSGMRAQSYCYRVISDLVEQLDKNKLDGEQIADEIFNRYFKDNYEKMKRFNKNHGVDVMETFRQCDDPKCCDPKQ